MKEITFKQGQIWKGYTLHRVVLWFVHTQGSKLFAVSECGRILDVYNPDVVKDICNGKYGEWYPQGAVSISYKQ